MLKKKYDVIVVGGGHAGIEASLSSSRLGCETLLVTMSVDSIGRMSCNPAVGGQAKGHLVRELDALGGEMAKLIDASGIHFKMLNKSKGPAVWSPRAQADKHLYEKKAQEACFNQGNLNIIEDIAGSVITENQKILGIETVHDTFFCEKLILTCGTFLNGKIYIGLKNYASGRAGEPAATKLTDSLCSLGFQRGRLKTGTPPRVAFDTVDWSSVQTQIPDVPPTPFSFQTKGIKNKQINMYITYTNEETHRYLRGGLHESPMYGGVIDGVGPRYCPSIEDKIVRFSERPRHQLFLEPEGYHTDEVYVNGFSTSLPEFAQIKALKTVPGLEYARILRLGYAIEYDYFEPSQLKRTMETRQIEGLYFAGQICGTSGYEEAATQGLIAGINASLSLLEKEPLVLSRTNSYIGVLIDDLIRKSTQEPYRMFTSSAEFRLLLRQDNADIRLMKIGHNIGLIPDSVYQETKKKERLVQEIFQKIRTKKISKEVYEEIKPRNASSIKQSETVYTLLKRPEITLSCFSSIDLFMEEETPLEIQKHVEFEIKYEGYIKRQLEEVARFKKNESKKIPKGFDYDNIVPLSNEAREKLKKYRPASIGQASRISGLRPSDLNVLLVYLEKTASLNYVSRET